MHQSVWRFRVGLAVLSSALVCGFLCGAQPALALRGHAFTGTFGEPCATGPCGEGKLQEPAGVAVNEQSGVVYVLDRGDGLIERFNPTGAYQGQFSGSETPAKAFGFVTASPAEEGSFIGGIAVDNSCYLRKLSAEACANEDPSNGDVYVADPEHEVVDKFNPEGVYLGQLQETPGGEAFNFPLMEGVSVDARGLVWVYYNREFNGDASRFSDGEPNAFMATSPLAGNRLGFGRPGFAVDAEDNLYVRAQAGQETGFFYLDKLNIKAESLLQPFVEEETSAVAVELSSNEVFLDNVTSVGAFGPDGTLFERFGSGELANGGGLAVSHANGTVYVADSGSGLVDVFGPEPPSKPTIEGESILDVASTSATLQAEVNPRGAETAYHFEYGRCVTSASCAASGYEDSTPTPAAMLGASFEAEEVSIHPQDLLASATYHFRIVATNGFATTDGPEQVFTTQPVTGEGLLADGRQWELVSPSSKHGALIDAPSGGGLGSVGPIQAAEDGSGITYLADLPTELEPSGYGHATAGQVLSVRAASGWSTRDIATPHGAPTRVQVTPEYSIFSADLSSGLAQTESKDTTLLSSEASEPAPYLRREALCDGQATASECYLPLVTSKEGFADVPPGTIFGPEPVEPTSSSTTAYRVQFKGSSPDLQHVLLKSRVSLTAVPGEEGHAELYEWSADVAPSETLRLVSVLPANEGGGPSQAFFASVGTGMGSFGEGARHSVTNDGSRVFWEAGEGNSNSNPRALYLRYNATQPQSPVNGQGECMVRIDACTLRLDVQQSGAPTGGQPNARFQVASTDGSKVFFTDSQRLTSDSGSQLEGSDLYECEMTEEAGGLVCKLRDLTPEHSGSSAEVRNIVSGASEDGSYVYFVANGVLSENSNGKGESAKQGNCAQDEKPTETCNLYEYHDGQTTFVATLAIDDQLDWGSQAEYEQSAATLTAYASPDGHYLTFSSARSLTGYDNRDALSGKPDAEVYLFDAVAGRLACVSCDPTGARPVGLEAAEFTPSTNGSSDARPHGEDVAGVLTPQMKDGLTRWIAANLPEGVRLDRLEGLYPPRALADGGRVFFDTDDALVPQDVNGNEDVYEFEPEATGSCGASSPTFSSATGGCVSLVSSGTSPAESGFLDASSGGGDVFFITNAKLSSQDYDTARDVYDAHVCTALVPCASVPSSVPPCESGDACKGAPALQPATFGAPASATFQGSGNAVLPSSGMGVTSKSLTRAQKLTRALRACRSKSKRKRSTCERQARKRYGQNLNKGRGAKKVARKVRG